MYTTSTYFLFLTSFSYPTGKMYGCEIKIIVLIVDPKDGGVPRTVTEHLLLSFYSMKSECDNIVRQSLNALATESDLKF